jgi:CheY-like chemotaxis protein
MNKSDWRKLAEARQETHRPLVLIVEDNEMQQRLYNLVKDEVGMIPYIVRSSQEAVLAAEALDFNLIIIDLHMPHIDGIECAKLLQELDRKRGTKTPTIAVTANAMLGDREKCMSAGMDDYLSKPFTLVELKKKISNWAA